MAGMLDSDSGKYSQWAGFGVGSYVEMQNTSEVSVSGFSFTSVMKIRKTLVEITPSRARVEIDIHASSQGQTYDTKGVRDILASPPPEKDREEMRVVDEPDGQATVVKQSFADLFHDRPWAEVEEVLDVAGRSLPCRRRENRKTVEDQEIRITTWGSEQIPGGVARFESQVGKTQSTRSIVTAYERK
jgi:hypothetical protein